MNSIRLTALLFLLAPALGAAQTTGDNSGSSGVLRQRAIDAPSGIRPGDTPTRVAPSTPAGGRSSSSPTGTGIIGESPDPAANPTSPGYRSDANPVTDTDCGPTDTGDDRSLPRRCLK